MFPAKGTRALFLPRTPHTPPTRYAAGSDVQRSGSLQYEYERARVYICSALTQSRLTM